MEYQEEMDKLNKLFIDNYDPHYWKSKMNINIQLLKNMDNNYNSLFPNEKVLNIEKVNRYIRLEIHYTYYHMLEAMFAILFAFLKDPVPWLWLSSRKRYNPNTFNGDIAKLLDNKYMEVFGFGSQEMVKQFLYPRIDIERINIQDISWQENVKTLETYIKTFASDFMDKNEYNSYKHGFRIFCNQTYFSIGKDGGDVMHKIGDYQDTNTFLDVIKDQDNDILEYELVDKTVDYERSQLLSEIVYTIICQAIGVRKSIQNKDESFKVSYFSMREYEKRSQEKPGINMASHVQFIYDPSSLNPET